MPPLSSTLEPGGRLLRPLDPTRLPADKLSRWMFTAIAWGDMNDEHRARWREWFAWAVSPEGDLWNPQLKCAMLRGAKLDEVDLSEVELRDADMTGASLRGANLSSANLNGVTLVRAHLEGAGLQRVRLRDADLADAHLAGADLTGADLSGALLHDLDLTQVDFKDARLFGTRITDPVWWVEMPRATLSGQTIFPHTLPEHPIQDVQGLPPLLRRQLADAQYLRDLWRKAGGFGRWMIWLWGLTCSFGQSLGRWALCTFLVLVGFGVVYMFVPFNISVFEVANGQAVSAVRRPDFLQAAYFSVSTFMTLGLGDEIPASTVGRLLVIFELVLGYIMLGGLVSIFSNKLARLS